MVNIPPDVLLNPRTTVTLDELVSVFEQTEHAIVTEIISQLNLRPSDEVQYTRQWAAGKLARTRNVKKRLQEIANNPDLIARIADAETLVKYSWLDGVEVATEQLPAPKRGVARARRAHAAELLSSVDTVPPRVRGLAHEQSVLLSQVRSNYWRAGNKAYRQAVAEVSSLVATGNMGSRQAARQVSRRLENGGVGAFVDKTGRVWSSRNYVDMCVRTVTHRANIVGKTDTFLALGERFVKVSEHEKECHLCLPWENKILVLEGEVTPPAVATLSQAQTKGLMHPRCRHTVELVIPQETTKKTVSDTPAPDAKKTVNDTPAPDAKKTVPQYLKAVEKGKQHFVTESGAKRTFGMLKDGTLDFDAAPVYTSQPVRTYKPGSQALKDLENLKTVGAELRKELDTRIESRKGEYTWTEKEQQERAEHVKQLHSKLSGIVNREWQKYGQTRKKPSQKRFWTWLRKNDQEYVKLEEEWRSESGKLSFGLKKIEEYDRVVREETLKMFEQIRPMGGLDLSYEFPIATPASGKKMLEAMKYAEQSYPREWLAKVHMDLDSPIQIFEVERGYNQEDKVIGLSRGLRAPVGGNDLAVTAIHELGHTMENNVRGLKQAEFTFLYERSSRTPIPKRMGTELYFEDNFGDAYSGRFYNRGNKDFQENQEILTTAWQQMIGGHDSEAEFLVTRVEKSVDNDYRDFILGMMAIL